MKISERGIRFIKGWERFWPIIYICPAGWPTIGYGHVIKKEELFPSAITEHEAEIILAKDTLSAEYSVNRLIKILLNQNQFDALVSFTFNLGGGALQRSVLRSMLNREEYLGAANEFLKWKWGGSPLRIMPGLYRRRVAERNLFLADLFPVKR